MVSDCSLPFNQAQKHNAEMKALAVREDKVWPQVDNLLETGRKIASVYDEVTTMLEKLNQLSEFQNTQDSFRAHLHQLETVRCQSHTRIAKGLHTICARG